MKAKDYLIRAGVAIVVIAAITLFIRNYPIVENLLLNLVFYAALITIAVITIRFDWKNITFGVLYGMMISVAGYIVYLIMILSNRLFG